MSEFSKSSTTVAIQLLPPTPTTLSLILVVRAKPWNALFCVHCLLLCFKDVLAQPTSMLVQLYHCKNGGHVVHVAQIILIKHTISKYISIYMTLPVSLQSAAK